MKAKYNSTVVFLTVTDEPQIGGTADTDLFISQC